MKLNRIILPAMAMALTLAACEDNKMEWGTPDGHGQADLSDIPLSLTEKIANYKSIKEYAAEYIPNMTVGLGIGADYYINNGTVKQLADANFNTFTTGNAMKHDAVVGNKGELNFATIDCKCHSGRRQNVRTLFSVAHAAETNVPEIADCSRSSD